MKLTDILKQSPAWPTVGGLPLPRSSIVGPSPDVEHANSSMVHIAVTHHSDTATRTSTALRTSRLALSETPAIPILLPVFPSASTFATSTIPLTTPSIATSSGVLPQDGNHDTSEYPFNYPSAPTRLFIAIANPLFVAVLCLAIFAVARSKFVREREKAALANGEPVSAATALRQADVETTAGTVEEWRCPAGERCGAVAVAGTTAGSGGEGGMTLREALEGGSLGDSSGLREEEEEVVVRGEGEGYGDGGPSLPDGLGEGPESLGPMAEGEVGKAERRVSESRLEDVRARGKSVALHGEGGESVETSDGEELDELDYHAIVRAMRGSEAS
ncbi:hypothetical protein LTR53_002741 [Teratosphaeriaceae sp. CCFEE 6253]|nr:hypothetical protein LTR53_002741 [Teratosphaeriaceae sp. CCFEE 6253]